MPRPLLDNHTAVAAAIGAIVDRVRAEGLCSPEQLTSLFVAAASGVVIAQREPGLVGAQAREQFIARCARIYDETERATRDASSSIIVPRIEGLES